MTTTRGHRGFTLVEAVCTMVVVAVLAVVSSRLVFTAADQYAAAANRAELSNELSAAMERIVNEVRQIPVRSGSSPSAPNFTGVAPASIAWTDASGTGRTIALSGTSLQSTDSPGTTSTLMSGVTAFAVQGYSDINATLASTLNGTACDPIRRVEITITAARNGVTETIRTRVFLRALGAGA